MFIEYASAIYLAEILKLREIDDEPKLIFDPLLWGFIYYIYLFYYKIEFQQPLTVSPFVFLPI